MKVGGHSSVLLTTPGELSGRAAKRFLTCLLPKELAWPQDTERVRCHQQQRLGDRSIAGVAPHKRAVTGRASRALPWYRPMQGQWAGCCWVHVALKWVRKRRRRSKETRSSRQERIERGKRAGGWGRESWWPSPPARGVWWRWSSRTSLGPLSTMTAILQLLWKERVFLSCSSVLAAFLGSEVSWAKKYALNVECAWLIDPAGVHSLAFGQTPRQLCLLGHWWRGFYLECTSFRVMTSIMSDGVHSALWKEYSREKHPHTFLNINDSIESQRKPELQEF